MSTKTLQGKPYRIEERGWPVGMPALEFDDRDDAVKVFDGIVEMSQRIRERNPQIRLVLLGPDRKVLPGGDR